MALVVALFAPPKDFSPAAVRFVRRMAYDRKCYAASLVDMAVKGYLKIQEADGAYTLTRTGKSEDECGLSRGEASMAGRLFFDGNSIELKQENHVAVAASVTALKYSLNNEYERAYFVTNSHWFVGGIAMLALTAFASAFVTGDPQAGVALVALASVVLFVAVLAHQAWIAFAGAISGPGSRTMSGLRGLAFTAAFVPFAGGWFRGTMRIGDAVPLPVVLTLSVGAIAAYAFYHLLKHPTLLGAKICDEIDGFKLYLVTAEKDRLEALNPPNVTPEVFEKFLPYAIALDCENQWSKKFEAEAEAAGVSPARGGYTPVWYSGNSFGDFGSSGFASSLGSSMAAAAASAATAPGSGSGGGGSSGGGGGGGGGGGW